MTDTQKRVDQDSSMDMDTSPGAAYKRRRIVTDGETNDENTAPEAQYVKEISQKSENERKISGKLFHIEPHLLEQLHEQHNAFCGRLNLDVTTKQISWDLFHRFLQQNSMDQITDQVIIFLYIFYQI